MAWPMSGDWAPAGYNFPSYAPTGSPYATGNTGYYNPSNPYGADRNWPSTPAIGGPSGYLEENPQAFYTRFIAPWGSGTDDFSRFVQTQFNPLYQGYEAAFATNPMLSFTDYLRGFTPQFFSNRWRGMTPSQRGFSGPLYGRGRMQWLV